MNNTTMPPAALESSATTAPTPTDPADPAMAIEPTPAAAIEPTPAAAIVPTPAAAIERLIKQNLTIATAESCTGGLLAKQLTDTPGASKAFAGGVVAYSNHAKTALLGIDAALINKKGAVSKDVAIAMADGARKKLGTDIGIGTTGIAGPESDESGLAPGTVFIAFAADGIETCSVLNLTGSRDEIRSKSVSVALELIIETMLI
ncbi:MAG: nicotinamide-nucleotide amidohydrolase family protein [Oscillospiraceae bacterium]|nr:nicotinamide-nucleotide amidohydrolase family protein [Oscillospiraceae bacterium]